MCVCVLRLGAAGKGFGWLGWPFGRLVAPPLLSTKRAPCYTLGLRQVYRL